MKKSFILLFSFCAFVGTRLVAQCNRPAPSDNPCTAPTFCNNDQIDGYCSSVTTPISGKKYLKPAGFCGSLESPSWFKFIADAAVHQFSFNANNAIGCNGNGVQAAVFDATDCTDSSTFVLKSNCINAMGLQPVATVTATGLVPGRAYYILVDGYQGEVCNYQILNIGAAIRPTNETLPTPSVIYGATSLCANATNVTYSVPKNVNASDYVFEVTINGSAPQTTTRQDSFIVIPSFPANGSARICVKYKNDCTESASARCIDVIITSKTIVTLPTVHVCSGNAVTVIDTFVDNSTSPVAADETINITRDKAGSGGCDTTFNVTVIKYTEKSSSQILFLKPTETRVICATSVSIPTNTCPVLALPVVCSGGSVSGCDSIINLTIINAKQTSTITPANPVLNCNSQLLQVAHSGICNGVTHNNSYQWFFQAQAGDPLSNLGNTTSSFNANQTGIYTVVVRDSVLRTGQAALGYRIFTDTIRVTVTGTSGTGVPTQPNLISGRSDTTVCQGSRTVLTIPAVANATTYTWSLVRNGGTIFSGQGTTQVTIDWLPSTSGDTVVVIANNGCGSSPARRLSVLILNFPNLNAGVDRAVCGTMATLSATNSTPNGTWFSASTNTGGVVFDDASKANANVQVTQPGVYQLVWRETVNTCSKSDTVQYTFNPIPSSSNLKDSCNVTRTNYFVKFNITGGTPPYQVYLAGTNTLAGTVGAGGLFMSNAMPLGSSFFEIKDANICSPPLISVSQNCTACNTNAGAMDVSTDLSICQGDTARATYLGGYVNDGNDTLQFVLHRGDPRSGIIARSNVPRFAYQAGMAFETRYFISAVAGDDSSRQVKITDPCFNYSPGVVVVFHQKPTATMVASDSNLCIGSCTNLRLTMTGKSPYSIGLRLTDATTRDSAINRITSGYLAQICPTQNTTYRLYSVRDSFGCFDTTLNRQLTVRVNPKVFAGIPKAPLSICSSLDTTISLATLLTNATSGGTWSEVSTVPSTGGAFTAASGRFRTRSQAVGIYRFAYAVRPSTASPCPNDTAFVNIEIKFTPIADAGADDTIRCNKPVVSIGGTNTSSGNSVTVAWSGGAGGNVPRQNVTQPGTFILTATSNGCSARDTVVIYVDTTSPRAVISPITQTVTCAVPSVVINGSTSTPIGQVDYLWFYNGIPFDNNAVSSAQFGGNYTLAVINLRNGCVDTDSITVNENTTPPTVQIARPSTINCKDTIVTIDASTSSNGAKYTLNWRATNGGRFLRDSTTLTPKVNVSGFYLLTVTDTTNSCKDSAFAFVPIDTLRPIASAIATDSIDCTNPTVALSGRGSTLSANISYNWVAQTGHIASGANSLNPVVDEPGFYILTVENTKNFCTNRDTVQVIKNNARPTGIKISTKKPTCYGECNASMSITSVIGGTAPYIYSLDAKVFTTRNTFNNQCAGTFKLTVQDAGGCTLDTTFSISQDKQLYVSLGADTTLKLGDSLLLKVLTNADTIKNIVWNPLSDSTNCPKGKFCTEQWVRPTRGTTYTATLTDQNGCRTVGTINVSIDKRRPIFVPSAFSPNNDSNNDVLMINGSQVVKSIKRFQIYDRWGEQVFARANFKTDDPNFGWDGRHKGRDALPGVYIYFIEVEYLDNTSEILEGDVTLMH
ncbi:MAG: gliding motility-associated C-terminal domain-containing protein [Saprospiraceae bacterium]|nr:gliding motility-associated C-terminal domain-containing protein [Saprospiraceae bacterium]